ncbi:hypothetical protein GG344DRAFT_83588 [Lentinula edodes]|nr:hypothetical protein GG344DRAFT_83588 [Lentinula edodes]
MAGQQGMMTPQMQPTNPPGGPPPLDGPIQRHNSLANFHQQQLAPVSPLSPGMNKDGSAKDINMKIEGSPHGGLPTSSAGMAPTASGPANGPSSMPVPPGRPPSSQNPAPNSGPHPGMPSLPPPNMDPSPGSMLGNVAISSIPLTPWLSETLPNAIWPPAVSESEHLLCMTSSLSNESSPSEVHVQCVPLLPGYLFGVGDLFSSLVLAHYNTLLESSSPELLPPFRTSLSGAVSQALTKTHAVLCKTFKYSERLPEEERLVTDDEKDVVEPIRKV